MEYAIGREYDRNGVDFSGGEMQKTALDPTALPCLIMGRLSSTVRIKSLFWTKEESIMNFGMHRRNIIRIVHRDGQRLLIRVSFVQAGLLLAICRQFVL